MTKGSNKKEKKKTMGKKKLTETQKEILFTIGVLIVCIIVGIVLGRILYQSMYGPL